MSRYAEHVGWLQSLCGIFFVFLIAGSLLVAGQSFHTRGVYNDIETVYRERVALETLQGKLRIERGYLLSPAYIEERAKEELRMHPPSISRVFSPVGGVSSSEALLESNALASVGKE